MKREYSKVLAICIPTFNRRNRLEENINSLLPQLTEEVLPFVEVHIFDNASEDDTPEYCQSLSEQYEFITYHRRPQNIGPDANFLGILSSDIDAQFYHLMSDDDLYAADSIGDLVSFLNENRECGFVYLNLESFLEDPYNAKIKHEPLHDSVATCTNLSKKQFMEYVGIENTFLSGLVFNHDDIDVVGIEKYIGTNWLQTYAFFQSTKDCEGRMGFFSKVTVCKRVGFET